MCVSAFAYIGAHRPKIGPNNARVLRFLRQISFIFFPLKYSKKYKYLKETHEHNNEI